MGSKSSTKSSNTTKDTTISNVDYRATGGDGSIGGNVNLNLADSSSIGGALSISTTDFGALDAASEIVNTSFDSIDNAVAAAANAASGAAEKSSAVADKALQVAADAQQSDTSQVFIVLAVSAAVAVSVWAYSRSRK